MYKAFALSLFAMLALTAPSASDLRATDLGIGGQAGTWEDDCNLSRRASASAAQPGTTRTSSWTRTTLGYHGRGCRQIALQAQPSDAYRPG